jgi:group I intron endonuclease
MAKTCNKFKVYLITNLVTGGQYVGITSTSISHRWRQHRFDARSGKKYRLHNAIRKYGEDKFTLEHIASAASEIELLETEKLLIAQYGTFGRGGGKGYNLTIGGGGTQGAGVERVVAGKVFPSLTDACDYYGQDRSRVSQRLSSRGWTIEQALDLEPPPVHKPSQAQMIEIGGAVFESFQAAVDAYNLNYETVRHRMLRDWSKEQAFGLAKPPPLLPTTGKQIVVDGVVYKSKADAARQLGVRIFVVSDCLKAGWSVEQAFGVEPPPPRPLKKGKEVVVGDMVFRSISAAARHFGMPIGTVAGRLHKEHLTCEPMGRFVASLQSFIQPSYEKM